VKTEKATPSCRTRKRPFHFFSPGVVSRSHTAAQQVPALLYGGTAAAAAADAADFCHLPLYKLT